MAKSSTNTIRLEQWNVADPTNRFGDKRMIVTKIATRNHLGHFHGATNFRGSRIGG